MAFNPRLLSLLGLRTAGDLGPLSMYTDKHGRLTVYPFSPPEKPPSPMQLTLRNRFRVAIANWNAMPVQDRRAFEAASKKAWLPMTGCNVFVSASLDGNNAAVQTLANQTRIPLPDVPYVA